jgi:PPP family 3-phenylpropionic acid transporter
MANAAGAFLTSFEVLYFQNCGLTGHQIGLLSSLASLTMMLTQPLWGMLADHTRRMGLILFGLAVISAVVEIFYGLNRVFPAFLILTCLSAVFLAPTGPLLDSYTFHHLGASNRKLYAHHRVWGTYSFFFLCLWIGNLFQEQGLNRMYFIVGPILLIMAFLSIFLEDVRLGELHESESTLHFQGVRKLISYRPFMLFLACMFIASLSNAIVWGFLSLYFRDIGTPLRFISMAWAVAIPLEIVIFLYAPQILDRWGVSRLVQVGLGGLALHWGLLYLFPTPWAAMAVQLVKGVAFAGSFVGAATMVDMMVPVKLKATGQTMLASSASLAAVIGAPIGGRLYDSIGAVNLCLVGAILGTISLGMYTWFAKDMKPEQQS